MPVARVSAVSVRPLSSSITGPCPHIASLVSGLSLRTGCVMDLAQARACERAARTAAFETSVGRADLALTGPLLPPPVPTNSRCTSRVGSSGLE